MTELIKLKLSQKDDLIQEYRYKATSPYLLYVLAEICFDDMKDNSVLWYRVNIESKPLSSSRTVSSIITNDLNEFLTFLFKRNIVFYEELK